MINFRYSVYIIYVMYLENNWLNIFHGQVHIRQLQTNEWSMEIDITGVGPFSYIWVTLISLDRLDFVQ
jgi:hypothetical protein